MMKEKKWGKKSDGCWGCVTGCVGLSVFVCLVNHEFLLQNVSEGYDEDTHTYNQRSDNLQLDPSGVCVCVCVCVCIHSRWLMVIAFV